MCKHWLKLAVLVGGAVLEAAYSLWAMSLQL